VYYNGSFYRRERPQKGRYRQFNQFGVELVGCRSWLDDVDCIAMAKDVLCTLGIGHRVALKINSLGDMESRQNYKQHFIEWLNTSTSTSESGLGLPIDLLSEESRARVLKGDVLKVLDSKRKEDIQVMKMIGRPILSNFMNEESTNRMNNIQRLLVEMGVVRQPRADQHQNIHTNNKQDLLRSGSANNQTAPSSTASSTSSSTSSTLDDSLVSECIPMYHDNSLVRGLDYYCHTTFEFVEKKPENSDNASHSSASSVLGGQQATVLAGGRYDGLFGALSDNKFDVPSVGWAMGMERVRLLMNDVEETNQRAHQLHQQNEEAEETKVFFKRSSACSLWPKEREKICLLPLARKGYHEGNEDVPNDVIQTTMYLRSALRQATHPSPDQPDQPDLSTTETLVYATDETDDPSTSSSAGAGSSTSLKHNTLKHNTFLLGMNVLLQTEMGKLKKQLKYANRENVRFCVLIGEDELKEKNCVLVKDMKTRIQEEVEVEDVVGFIQRQLL
jgi:histidyl-tRNA synthetase